MAAFAALNRFYWPPLPSWATWKHRSHHRYDSQGLARTRHKLESLGKKGTKSSPDGPRDRRVVHFLP